MNGLPPARPLHPEERHSTMRNGIVRSVAAFAGVAAIALGTAACSSGEPTAEGPVTLEMWTFLDPNTADEPRGLALKAIAEEFNAQNPDVQVEIRNINYADIDAEVIRSTASGSGPDIINIYSNQLPTHVDAGTVLPIGEYAEGWLAEQGDNYLFPLDGVTFDDQLMALPWETRAWLLWYRADMLEEAGLEVPTTLDELGDVAAALNGDGVTGLGIGFASSGLGASFVEKFIPLTWAAGGDILAADGTPAFTDGSGAEALSYLQELHEKGAFGEEALTLDADGVLNGIKASTISMAIEGSFRVSAARSGEGVGDNLKAIPIPSDVPGTPLQTPVAGQTLAIGANTENAEAAWSFIEFYLSESSQAKFAGAGVLPVLASVYELPEVQALPNAEELVTWRDYVLEHGRANPVSARFNELSEKLVLAGQQSVFQGKDPQTALEEAAAAYGG